MWKFSVFVMLAIPTFACSKTFEYEEAYVMQAPLQMEDSYIVADVEIDLTEDGSSASAAVDQGVATATATAVSGNASATATAIVGPDGSAASASTSGGATASVSSGSAEIKEEF